MPTSHDTNPRPPDGTAPSGLAAWIAALPSTSPSPQGNAPDALDGSEGLDAFSKRYAPAPEGGSLPAVEEYLAAYAVLPQGAALVIAAWAVAAWLQDQWDRFPHLAVVSPGKRCGKTTLLDLLHQIVPRPRYTTNISPAALYRVIEKEHPTLLMDESQSISRRGSEASEVIREILNAGIGKNARVTRCGGANHDQIEEFATYSPKVFAMIGEPDGVLADRSLLVAMRRKMKDDKVRRYRSREVEEYGSAVRAELEKWVAENTEKVAEAYATIEPFDIENDRLADLLTPLQAVLAVGAPDRLKDLEQYARGLDERDHETDCMEPELILLSACRELFAAGPNGQPYPDEAYISTKGLIGMAWTLAVSRTAPGD